MTIPGTELVGRNASVTDGVYRDDYTRALNEHATVDEVFGASRERIANGENVATNYTLGTLGVAEYEDLLISLVISAARAGEWRAVERKSEFGLEAVSTKGFGHVVDHGDQKFLLPSANYVEYCKQQ